MDDDSGALAQLGERFHGMEEVIGSIPLGSTITVPAASAPATPFAGLSPIPPKIRTEPCDRP